MPRASSGSATFSRAEQNGRGAARGITSIPSAAAPARSVTTSSPRVTEPSATTAPAMAHSSDDFPAPLCPVTAMSSPAYAVSPAASTATSSP